MQDRAAPLDTHWGAVVDLMNETGWSWVELASTPWPLVLEKINHIAAERHWISERERIRVQTNGR